MMDWPTFIATLASFASAWLLEDLAHLHTDVIILAVVLAMTLGRTQRENRRREWLICLGLVPVAAIGAAEVAVLMGEHPLIGDALFTCAIAATIWIRRYGPRATRAGTQAALPFIAALVTPALPATSPAHLLWTGLAAAIAVLWCAAISLLALNTRFAAPPTVPTPSPSTSTSPKRAPSSTRRIPASTRMALQMATALAAAFLLGHRLYPNHWAWLVLTAYIVAAGNRGRVDVLHKSALRVIGAAVGTLIATLLANSFPPGDKWAVVALFAALALATWLRPLSYGFWAGGVTAAMAFLYGYFGESGVSLLHTRLEGILWGAAIAIAAAWWILPIKSGEVLRRRAARSRLEADLQAGIGKDHGLPDGHALNITI